MALLGRLAVCAFVVCAPTASLRADDFWKYWGDGQAELSGYRLTQPRYGAKRTGTAVLIYVTEDFSESARVKADPGKHPASDVHPVMKLNSVRDFQTGIYDYNVMTSTFARVAAGWPVSKISFSSQEWCGHVYHQLLPRGDGIEGTSHSYFDGEADRTEKLALPKGGVFEDALAILLRGLDGEFLAPGESRKVPLLPSLLRARLEHRPLVWTTATIRRAAATESIAVPAGRMTVTTWSVAIEQGPTLTLQFEVEEPHRLVRYASDAGEELALLRSTRLAYWKLNGPGGEAHLRELGLAPQRTP